MNTRTLYTVLIFLCCTLSKGYSAGLSKPGACFSTQALERFASAYAEAYRIRQVYGPRVEQSIDPLQIDKLIKEADAAVDQVIRDHNLDVPSFFMLEEAIFGFRGVDFGPAKDRYELSPQEIQHIVNLVQEKMAQQKNKRVIE